MKKQKLTLLVVTVVMMMSLFSLSAMAAEDGDLVSIGFAWMGGLDEATEINGSQFELSGNISTFNFNELANVVLLVDGVESDAKLLPKIIFRMFHADRNVTEFCFDYDKTQLTHPAEYVLTCEYRGEQWRGTTLTWNANGTIEFDDSTFGVVSTPEPAALTATPTASKVLVNGEQVAFDAYNIGGNNYFKLRDLAITLNGTEKQFEVAFDSAANAIALTSRQPYTAVGGEMTTSSAGSKTPTATASKILLDGAEVSLTAYNIGGNNYFKLRDIGLTFDFGVSWDNGSSTISIDTSVGYTAE